MNEVKVYAPASIGNIGPGFDVLGMAINGFGDIVIARKREEGIKIRQIIGDSNIPIEYDKNTAGIAAAEVLKKLGIDNGVELILHKNVPVAGGLGSSAASAVAAGYAVNLLYGNKLSKEELIMPVTSAEFCVSGAFFTDNTASSMLGGVVVSRSYEPLEVIKIGSIDKLIIVIAVPDFQLETRKSRSVIPEKIQLKNFISNMANSCSIVAAVKNQDIALFGRSVDDVIIEPARAQLIPGFYDVKKAALENDAYGCSIAGAGPSVFAITDDIEKAKQIGSGMQKAFERNNISSKISISKQDETGARKID